MTSRIIPAVAVVALTFLPAIAGYAANPSESPQQLIKDVVYNELMDHERHDFFEYLDEKRGGGQTVVKAEIETRCGRLHRVIEVDGKPLTQDQQQAESRRIDALLRDSGQQQRLLRDYQGDEDRIARIVRLLPEGFLYEFDGTDGSNIRLKYRPNPAFKPPTYEAKVFHAMAGTVWIDTREKRLSRLQGQLVANIDFGYGLLGRLDKGGTFDMQRLEVTTGNWKTRVLDVHITGHVILLKSIGKDQDEVRSEFRQVPGDLDLQHAEVLLSGPQFAHQAGQTGFIKTGSSAETKQEKKIAVSMALK